MSIEQSAHGRKRGGDGATAFASTVTCWETSLMFSGMVMVHILPCVELDRATIG